MNPNQISEIKKFYKEDKNKNKLKEDLKVTFDKTPSDAITLDFIDRIDRYSR